MATPMRAGSTITARSRQRLIRPALAGHIPARRAPSTRIASARAAALLDPEGESLAKCLGEIEGQSAFRIAAE